MALKLQYKQKFFCIGHRKRYRLFAIKACFFTGVEWVVFVCFINYFYFFPRLKRRKAQSEAKKSINETNNTPFHARSGNEPLNRYFDVQAYEKLYLFYLVASHPYTFKCEQKNKTSQTNRKTRSYRKQQLVNLSSDGMTNKIMEVF